MAYDFSRPFRLFSKESFVRESRRCIKVKYNSLCVFCVKNLHYLAYSLSVFTVRQRETLYDWKLHYRIQQVWKRCHES